MLQKSVWAWRTNIICMRNTAWSRTMIEHMWAMRESLPGCPKGEQCGSIVALVSMLQQEFFERAQRTNSPPPPPTLLAGHGQEPGDVEAVAVAREGGGGGQQQLVQLPVKVAPLKGSCEDGFRLSNCSCCFLKHTRALTRTAPP